MRVIQVIPANIVDGKIYFSPFIRNEITNLRKGGIEVIEYHFIKRSKPKDVLQSIKELKALIQKVNPDIIHAQFGSTTAFITMSAAKNHVPSVITFGGSDLLGYPNVGFYWRVREFYAVCLSRFAAKRVTSIITVSENLRKALPKKLQTNSVVIPRGIDTDFFNPLNKYEARKQIGWSLDKTIVLFNQSRKNAQVKNFPLAEASFKLYQARFNPSSELKVMVGQTSKTVLQMLSAADSLLVTSFHEGSPNIVKESMACNLPVVTVPCGDVAERLANVSPSRIEDYNEGLLAKALHEVCVQSIRSNGRDKCFQQGIDNRGIWNKIHEVYEASAEIKKRK